VGDLRSRREVTGAAAGDAGNAGNATIDRAGVLAAADGEGEVGPRAVGEVRELPRPPGLPARGVEAG
jgi:hypothetical protein